MIEPAPVERIAGVHRYRRTAEMNDRYPILACRRCDCYNDGSCDCANSLIHFAAYERQSWQQGETNMVIKPTTRLALCVIALTGCASLRAAQNGAAPAQPAAAAGNPLTCANFSFIAGTSALDDEFPNAGFIFKNLAAAGKKWHVVESAGERGLQFSDRGMEISLQQPASSVQYRLGTFAGEVVITAYDDQGQVHTETIKADDMWTDRTFTSPRKFEKLKFSKGGGEGNLQRICVSPGSDD